MNNTFFTRKLVLGMLMALVLVFGVQDVADAALTATKSSSSDLQVKPLVTNQTFEFSFSISGVPGSTHTDARESITITSTVQDVDEVRIGSRTAQNLGTITADGSGLTLTERHGTETAGNARLINDTIYMKIINPSDVGVFTVTVTDQASPAGFDPLTFTAYAVRLPADVQDLRFAASTPTVNPTTQTTYPPFDTNDPLYDEVVAVTVEDVGTTTDSSSWAFVDFEVVEGPGFVYDDLNSDSQPDTPADRNSKTTTTLTRDDSVAMVRLRTNGGTNKIRATITNTQPAQTYEVIYLYQGDGTTTQDRGTLSVTLSHTSGNSGDTITVTATTTG